MDSLPSESWSLIRSGYSSPTDTLALNGYIHRKEEELASHLADIAQRKRRLLRPTKKQTELDQSIKYHKFLLAPIRRLPPELLSEIFTHCLDYEDWVRPSIKDVPMLLLRVNARWRDVALKTPQLWAKLSIHRELDPEFLDFWLSRSGACPLNLEIGHCFSSSVCRPFQSMASLDFVCMCQRLRRLHLWIEGPIEARLFPINPVDMPLLEDLLLCLPDTQPDDILSGFIPLASAPHLRHCDLRFWRGVSQPTPIPWSHLTYLTLHASDGTLEILHQCTNLIRLELSYCDLYPDDDDLPTSFRPILLPHLTVLNIKRLDPASGLACFDTPSLQDLSLRMSFSQDVLYLPQRCGPELVKFDLSKADHLPPEGVENCFARMPELRQLDIMHDNALRILSHSVTDNGRRLLPNLQRIVIRGEPRLADVVDFIKARWNPSNARSQSIQEIRATPAESEAPRPEQLKFLRQCLDEGLHLSYDIQMLLR